MTDVNKLITDNIDVWTSAVKKRNATGRGSSKKIELTGIKKLRKLILELAIRGKLVPQNPNDEPVSILLDKIVQEKTQLIADKKIKVSKAPLEITDEEKPFCIPNTWVFKRFGEVMFNRDGERKPVSADERKGIQGRYDYYGASGVIDQVNDFLFDKSLLLIGEDGANLISRTTPIAFLAHGKYWVNNHAHVLDGITTHFLEFIALHINAISLEKYITGTAQPKMNQAKMNSIVIAIPPEVEQHRIVAKVDELMTLCDQLEQQTEQSLLAHQTLVEVLLNTLTQSVNAGDFQESWQRIADHFDVLFTTAASIDQLKQTILQLAVMGKLVPQNPSDEPASKLLEKIAVEKAKLIKDKKIKKQTLLPAITDEKKPFEIPTGWSYTRLDDLCANVFSGSTPPKSELNETSGIPFLKVYNIQNQELEFDQRTLFVSENSHTGKLKRSILYPGDVILNIVGPPLGKVAIMPNTYPEWNCNQNIICFRPLEIKLNRYIYTYLKAHIFLDYIDLVGSAGQDFISGAKCRAIVLPMPPLAEQHRIVAKVDELMALCDQLKVRLADAQTIQLHLADTVVENALN